MFYSVHSKFDQEGVLIGPQGGSVWLNQVPEGMFEVLMWVNNRYDHPIIVITENGCDMLGEDIPRTFDAGLFFPESRSTKNLKGGESVTEGVSLEELLADETELTKSLLTDDFRSVALG